MSVTIESRFASFPGDYKLVDDISEAAIAREAEREHARNVLEGRREEQIPGAEAIPPVDALSTAHRVLEASHVYGEDSEQCRELFDGLVLDCQRLMAEWYRKKKPEYFPPVRHTFDPKTEEFFSHGLSVRQMTQNALLPIPDNPEEEARRINEKVEDATPQILRRLGGFAVEGCTIRTVSECLDKAIADYNTDIQNGDKHRGYDGYVPEIEKLMIRDISLRGDTHDRFEEQVGLPGTFISHYIVQMALSRAGVAAESMDKTELHGAQLLVHDDLMGFVALLDTVASEQWSTNIFMGEEVPEWFEKNYENFRHEALQRQEGLKEQASTVATFVLDLARDGVDRRLAPAKVEDFVKKLLLDMAKNDIEVAEQMFDKKTAVGLQEVARLESIGQFEQAYVAMRQVEAAAPGGGYCGGGSCGLTSVNKASEAGKELAKQLKAGIGDTVVTDSERSCKCGSKKIAYAYNATKVNKYCQDCKRFESKRSVAV